MKKALLVVDYTIDFVAEDGLLTCGLPGQKLEQAITALTQDFLAQGDAVFFINDLHEENDTLHPENKLFPPHNIRGTTGRNMYGALHDIYQTNPAIIWLDKTRYSAFAGTNLFMLLRERGIEALHIVGVCTDICILHTCIDAYNLGYTTFVHEAGVASFNEQAHHFALAHIKNSLGFTII